MWHARLTEELRSALKDEEVEQQDHERQTQPAKQGLAVWYALRAGRHAKPSVYSMIDDGSFAVALQTLRKLHEPP